MASSQVEMASSAPFRCVLSDRNRRERCRDVNARATQAAFQKNLKDLVRDHLSNCIPDDNPHGLNNDFDNRQGLRLTNHNSDNRDNVDNGSSPMSSRQSRFLDRWAARQAREMVSTIKHEVELLSSSNSVDGSPRASEHCVFPSDGSVVDASNLGASSLVQMWEARLKPPNSLNVNLTVCTSRTNSGSSIAENLSFVDDSIDERFDTPQVNGECFPDSDSDRTPHSDRPPSSQGCNSDAGESERVRVVDIIRRLTSANQTNSGDENDHEHPIANESSSIRECSVLDQVGMQHVTCSPRIRGRQAFHDLLMQMERNRQRELDTLQERRAVSRFSQRGRIQSLLRLRALQRDIAVQDQYYTQTTVTEVKRIPQGSNIVHLRKRFGTGIEQGMPSDTSNRKSPCIEMINNTPNLSETSTSSQLCENVHNQEANTTEQKTTLAANKQKNCRKTMNETRNFSNTSTSNQLSQNTRNQECNTTEPQSMPAAKQKGNPCAERVNSVPNLSNTTTSSRLSQNSRNQEDSTAEPQSTPSAQQRSHCIEIVNNTLNLSDSSSCNQLNEDSHHQELNTTELQSTPTVQQSLTTETEDLHEEANPISVTWSGTSIENNNLDSQETLDTTESMNDWNESEITEEGETYDQQQFEDTNYDWISDISRPRSYWEDQRRAWYEEILNTNSNNEEIRQLLERRRVSSFLDSDFRVRMDRLMMSHLQMQTHEEELNEDGGQDRMDQLLSYLQRHSHTEGSHEEEREGGGGGEEEEDEEDEEEENEEQSQISGQFHEATNYFNQSTSSLPSPSLLRSWSFRDNEVGDDSDQVASTTSHQPLPSPMFYQDAHHISSSRNSTSIEMELIYDLKGHMEQLHREMSELRESIKSCMDMQQQLRESTKKEVHSGEIRKPLYGKKGVCCICYKMQVDSLLYRCGHMCTCLKCAHELQWSSGKCPICRAPIVDVVRTYADS